MSILIKNIVSPTVRVYDPSGGTYIINEYEWMDLRVKIMKAKIPGWKFNFGDNIEDIDINGRMKNYPPQFEIMEKYLDQLLDYNRPI